MGKSIFTRNSSTEPKGVEPRKANGSANVARFNTPAPASTEKSVIGNDLKIVGQGLKIIGRGLLQIDGEIEGDVQAAEVVVGEKGKVTGMVAGQKVIVGGTVSGVVCGQTVGLQASLTSRAIFTTCHLSSSRAPCLRAAAAGHPMRRP